MVILDCETYTNYFLVSFMQTPSRQIVHVDTLDDSALDTSRIKKIMRDNTTVSFNGNSYDLTMLVAACGGYTCQQLKALSDELITGKGPTWMTARNHELQVPKSWDHIDLIEVAPGQSSLKIYGGRLHAPRLQDLPITPEAIISEDDRQRLRDYCENDLETTRLLAEALDAQLDLRVSMSEQYGIDLRSKSDAQIAETVIKSELSKATGKQYGKVELPKNYSFRYRDPGNVQFETPQLQQTLEQLTQTDFELSSKGSVMMPDWLKKQRVEIAGKHYQMGIGGLHSCEKRRVVEAAEGEVLAELDVASYYPSIILQQQLAPESLGRDFLRVYESIVKRRLRAKKEGDKVTADTLKICVNGSFGKLNSRWSALYAPDLFIQTTITGQLALLMLIERLEAAGISVVSANTDGVIVHHSTDLEQIAEEVTFTWQLDTGYELERNDYTRMASRDVNTYVAVSPDGSTKGKGGFADESLMKNPDKLIIYDAVAEYIKNGIPVADTIRACQDLRRFVTVRTVKGGALWRGHELGKAVRYYYSNSVSQRECIQYAMNGNKVPASDGAMPVMDLPESLPSDIDYEAYIVAAEKLLCEVGAA